MRIKIRLHPGSSQEKVEQLDNVYNTWIKEKAIDGKANLALIKFLRKCFKSKEVRIISGLKSRNKLVEIL